jgi:hypothetical protein
VKSPPENSFITSGKPRAGAFLQESEIYFGTAVALSRLPHDLPR